MPALHRSGPRIAYTFAVPRVRGGDGNWVWESVQLRRSGGVFVWGEKFGWFKVASRT